MSVHPIPSTPVDKKPRRTIYGFCVYCGAPVRTQHRPIVCRLHDDLPRLDPRYSGGGDQWAEAR